MAEIFPVEHLAAAIHLASVHATFGAAVAPGDLLVLAAWGVGAAIFAARRFSWLPSAGGGASPRRRLVGRGATPEQPLS